jgi:hypothetical protein
LAIFSRAALAMNAERVRPRASAATSIASRRPASIDRLTLAGRPVSRRSGTKAGAAPRAPGRAAGGDLLAGPAEDHRIAAFQAHHAFARLGERHHHPIDVVLFPGQSVSGLADQHLSGLPPFIDAVRTDL